MNTILNKKELKLPKNKIKINESFKIQKNQNKFSPMN